MSGGFDAKLGWQLLLGLRQPLQPPPKKVADTWISKMACIVQSACAYDLDLLGCASAHENQTPCSFALFPAAVLLILLIWPTAPKPCS